jgi:replicative DNA helicase
LPVNPLLGLIKHLLNTDTYNQFRIYLNQKELTPQLKQILFGLDELHLKYQRNLTLDELKFYCVSKHQDVPELLGIFESIEAINIQEDLAKDLLLQYKQRNIAHNIALLAIDVNEGRKEFDSLLSTLNENADLAGSVTEEYDFVTDNLEELYNETIKQVGLRWRLQTLNRMLGSLRPGDFGFIFARPETGKTTFLASEITFFAEQLKEEDGPILWINNEENGKKVKLRLFQASLGIPLPALISNLAENQKIYDYKTHGKIKLFDKAIVSKSDIEVLCKRFKPSLVVIDQIDKICGFDGDREDLKLGAIYTWAREIAKTYCPVIGVTQADGTAEGKKWLTMDNVSNAKTAKQSEADWILGIGSTHAEGFEFVRHLHLSKNKLSGDTDTDPELRHGKQDVLIEPQIARYRDYN